MKNIIFIAPPAAGKGTQSFLLVKKYNYNHISTGNLLRSEIAAKTELGISIENKMKSGEFISDEIVSELLINRLKTINGPFILDGYPRNIEQVEFLINNLNSINKKIDIVIYLNVSFDETFKRVTGRLSCPKCHRTYHKYEASVKPKAEWICDDCYIQLVNRSDDNEETFKVRYNEYDKNTVPVLDYYKKQNILFVIDNPNDPAETFKLIEKVIQ